jgi:hypothetical protein
MVRIMELFQVIPERLFGLLASPLKEAYAAILFRIYDQYQLTTFGMEREVVVDVILDYLETLAEQSNVLDALGEDIPEEGEERVSLRGRASALVRKLENSGWIKVETWANYQQYVSLPDYAIKLLDTLDKIRQNRQVEYQSFIYAVYTAVTAEEALRQPHLALDRAYETTLELVNHLKTLNHNIKRYLEKVLAQEEAAEILRLHFEDYKLEVLDKAYHRLKTADNVSRYRPKIIERVQEWLHDPLWVSDLVNHELRLEKGLQEDQCRNEIYRKLETILQVYLGLDELLEEIDRRNSQYAAASLRQVQYILSSGKNTEGQLLEILKYLADLRREGHRADSLIRDEVSEVFSIFSQKFLDWGSLFTARLPARPHSGGVMGEDEEDPAAREQRLRSYIERMARRLTRDKVNQWVLERMEGRNEVRAIDLNIWEIEDYVNLIYTAVYARSKKVQYTVDFREQAGQVEYGEFRFPNFRIKKKVGRVG